MSLTTTDTAGTECHVICFNQDFTSMALGSNKGHRIFNLEDIDNLDIVYEGTEDIFLLERLFSSSLVAFVSYDSPRKLLLRHIRKNALILNSGYSNTILALKLNRKILVVCLEESLFIHDIRNMEILHTIKDTPSNPQGICALSSNTDNNDIYYLAYPGSVSIGEVQIFDALNMSKLMIPAHNSPLAAISFDANGLLVATASEKGTVIRVFTVLTGAKIYEFRRGVKRCVSISSLNFSNCSRYLSCSSNTETVHVFKLEELKLPIQTDDDSGWINYLSRAVTSASVSYLPSQVTDVFSQDRAFATAYLSTPGIKNITAVTKIQGQLRLLVGTAEGILYVCNIDDNGEVTLYKQHDLHSISATSYMQNPLRKDSQPSEGMCAGGSYAGVLKGCTTEQMTVGRIRDIFGCSLTMVSKHLLPVATVEGLPHCKLFGEEKEDKIRELDDAAFQPGISGIAVNIADKQEFPSIDTFGP